MVSRFGILLVLSVKRLYNRLSLLRCISLHCLPDIHQYSLWTKNKQDICTLNFYRITSETSTNILSWTKQARTYPKWIMPTLLYLPKYSLEAKNTQKNDKDKDVMLFHHKSASPYFPDVQVASSTIPVNSKFTKASLAIVTLGSCSSRSHFLLVGRQLT